MTITHDNQCVHEELTVLQLPLLFWQGRSGALLPGVPPVQEQVLPICTAAPCQIGDPLLGESVAFRLGTISPDQDPQRMKSRSVHATLPASTLQEGNAASSWPDPKGSSGLPASRGYFCSALRNMLYTNTFFWSCPHSSDNFLTDP